MQAAMAPLRVHTVANDNSAFIWQDPGLGSHYHTRGCRLAKLRCRKKRAVANVAAAITGGREVMTQAVVQIRDLRFARGSRTIFDGVDLDIMPGSVTAIMGPSGTGKTTLLKLIGGQLRPLSGSIRVQGEEVPALSRVALYRLRRTIGMLFQSGALLTDISVFENVAYPIREHTKLPESMIRDLVLMKLEAVGLRGAAGMMPSELSGGMSRRVALARAIALDPQLVLYDEPFTGQDPISMGVLVKLIRELNQALGLTSVVVSHDVREASAIADYVYLLSDGKVMDHGTPDALWGSQQQWTQQFLNGHPDGPVAFHYPAPPFRDDLLGGAVR
jgi:phospholipid/cholesterol/gamma-HCH transport system ATP-binding protein